MEIKSRFDHFNFNVLDLDRSICFYEKRQTVLLYWCIWGKRKQVSYWN